MTDSEKTEQAENIKQVEEIIARAEKLQELLSELRDAARSKAETDGAERFDKWESIFTEHGKPTSWSVFLARCQSEDKPDYTIDDARKEFRGQPAMKAWNELGTGMWGSPIDDYGFDRDAYLQRCRDGALVPFAIVKDGKWHERGSMGWWGCVSDEKDRYEWNKQVAKLYDELYDELDPDTIVTLVDFHV